MSLSGIILLSVRSQFQRVTYCMILFVWHSQKDSYSDRSVVATAKGGKKVSLQRETRVFWGMMELFCILFVVVVMQMNMLKFMELYTHKKELTLLNVNWDKQKNLWWSSSRMAHNVPHRDLVCAGA